MDFGGAVSVGGLYVASAECFPLMEEKSGHMHLNFEAA